MYITFELLVAFDITPLLAAIALFLHELQNEMREKIDQYVALLYPRNYT